MVREEEYQLVYTEGRPSDSDESDTAYGMRESILSLHHSQISSQSPTLHKKNANSRNMLDTIQSHWKYGLALLGIYGFFIEMKPSEPYLTPYLAADKNFTNDEINNRIYPYWTYGQLVVVFFVPLMAKVITPKRLFYLETLGFLVTRALLIWGSSLFVMQLMQVTYAIGTSVKSIYYCYMYLIFEKKHFGTATGFVWGAQAFGMFISGILGQVLVNADVSYLSLNFISMGSVCLAFFFTFLIPEKKYESNEKTTGVETPSEKEEGCGSLASVVDTPTPADPLKVNHSASGVGGHTKMVAAEYMQVFRLFRDSRGPMSFTWILTKCVEELVQNYASNLWYNLSDDTQYYGAVFALYHGFGVIGALLLVLVRVLVKNESFQSTVICIFQGIASIGLLVSLILMTATNDLRMEYLSFVTFGFFYYVFITGVSCSMAADSQPLEQVFLFAANLFCAVVIETIITLILSNINAQPKIWFTVACAMQGITIPVYLYQSYKARKMQAQNACYNNLE